MENNGLERQFYWGMNTHHRNYDAYPETNLAAHVALCKELGTNMIRFNFNPHTEDDYAYLDKVVDLCRGNGQEMMLVLDDFRYYSSEAEYRTYTGEIGRRYRGKIRYYQVFNETDVYATHLDNGSVCCHDGKELSEYNPARLTELLPRMRGGVQGLKEADPDARLVINIAWWHYGILDYYRNNGVAWDVIGLDWYADMERNSDIYDLLNYLSAHFPEQDLMLCECNAWGYENPSEEEQAAFNTQFMRKVFQYASDRVKGLIFYELMDEPALEPADGFHGEAHFGFVKCARGGAILDKKLTFDAVKQSLRNKAYQ